MGDKIRSLKARAKLETARQAPPGIGTAHVPCTCGELVQGVLEGEPFLVSCPIDRYSRVRVCVGSPGQRGEVGLSGLDQAVVTTSAISDQQGRTTEVVTTGVMPGPSSPRTTLAVHGGRGHDKARLAAAATLALLGYPEAPFTMEVSRPLPPSKGFGTSTADVVGAIVAAAAAVEASLDPEEVARLAAAIEPSDSTMFPGLAFFNHRSGRQWEILGPSPSLTIAVLEFEGDVDTLDYNARLDLSVLRSMEPAHATALEMLWRGLKTGQPELIGQAATASARINQLLLPKPELEGLISLGERFDALGVCVAHSGTAAGVLFGSGESQSARRLLAEARGSLKGLQGGWLSRMVGGGPRVLSVVGESRQVVSSRFERKVFPVD